jgi:hypothetical protein
MAVCAGSAVAWPANGTPAGRARVNPPGATAPISIASRSDDTGGIYLAWPTYVDGSGWTVQAQRLTAAGAPWPGWPAAGRTLGTPGDGALAPQIITDAHGGILVFWSDWDDVRGTYELAAQRVLSTGVIEPSWPAGGKLLGIKVEPGEASVVPDDSGGALIGWLYRGSGALLAMRALHITSLGAVAAGWTAGGLTLATTAESERPHVATNGDGYVFVAWSDQRGPDPDIYVSRVALTGAIATGWPTRGLRICGSTGDQIMPSCVADGTGGVLVVWYDLRRGNWEPYATRINAAGTLVTGWVADGKPACGSAGSVANDIVATSDGASGIYITWSDLRAGGNNVDVYTQRMTASGGIASGWPAQALAVVSQPNEQELPASAPDGSGGLLVVWQDRRSGLPDVYLKRLTASGGTASGWPAQGAALCVQPATQWRPTVVRDNTAGGIAAWLDDRTQNADSVGIYANRRNGAGASPTDVQADDARRTAVLAAWPNPSRTRTRLQVLPSSAAPARLGVYDAAGRCVRTLVAGSLGTFEWDGTQDDGTPCSAGTYFVHARDGAPGQTLKLVRIPASPH